MKPERQLSTGTRPERLQPGTNRTATKPSRSPTVRYALMAELQREEITRRIREARQEKGLTMEEVAEAIDVGVRTYWNYEHTRVPWASLGAIAELTGKTKEWLIHGPGEETPALPAVLGQTQLDRIEQKLDLVLTALTEGGRRLAAGAELAEAGQAIAELHPESAPAVPATPNPRRAVPSGA